MTRKYHIRYFGFCFSDWVLDRTKTTWCERALLGVDVVIVHNFTCRPFYLSIYLDHDHDQDHDHDRDRGRGRDRF